MKIKKWTGTCAVVLIFLGPYFYYFHWRFPLATALIFLAARLAWGPDWIKITGLGIPKRDLVVCGILGIIFYFAGAKIIPTQIEAVGGTFTPYTHWLSRVSPFFQALNEEIVLRALLLSFLIRLLKSLTLTFWLTSWLAAAVFAVLHWVLYHFNDQGVTNLAPTTLLNLLLFGVLCNALYFKFRHIGYGLALHAAWNLTRFSADYRNARGDFFLEGQTFNLVEGSLWLTVFLVLSLVTVSFLNQNLK